MTRAHNTHICMSTYTHVCTHSMRKELKGSRSERFFFLVASTGRFLEVTFTLLVGETEKRSKWHLARPWPSMEIIDCSAA